MLKLRLPTTSFRGKLIINISLLILLTILASSIFNYQTHKRLFISAMKEQVQNMNEELLKRIDMQQTAVVKMSNSIIFNPYVQNALTRVQNPANLYNLYLDQQELKALTSQMHIDNPQLLSMYIFDQQGYNRKENTFSVIPDKQMSEFYNQLAQAMTGEDGMVWFTRQFTHENELNTVILNARWMRSKDFETYGLLLLAFNPNLFGSLLEIKSGPNQYILYSQAGEILTSRFEDENLALIDWLAHEPDQTVIPKNYLAVKSKSKTSQMELVQFISLSYLSVIFLLNWEEKLAHNSGKA